MNDERVKVRYPGEYPVFFVGASAGGVRAMQYLAAQLPADFPAAVFMVLHRKAGAANRSRSGAGKDLLPDLLKRKAKMKVVISEAGESVKAGHIYLPARGQHLVVEDNMLVLSSEPRNSPWCPSIDVLFKAGAREYTERAVAILLTGGLDDGIEGLRETTFHGGITIAQSPEDAYDPILPLNALINDHPAFVAPLNDLPALMCELCSHACFAHQQAIAEHAALAAAQKKVELMSEQHR